MTLLNPFFKSIIDQDDPALGPAGGTYWRLAGNVLRGLWRGK